ncbi:MAG: insulinase family protein, partial [Candidatus Paceibacterota bacterium]
VVVFFGPKHEEVRRIVTHELGDWGADWKAGRNKEAKCPRMTGKNGFKPLVKPIFSHRQRKGISQYNVVIGYPTESYMSNDTEALKILASILGDRMYKHLRHNNFEYGKGIYHPGVDTEFTTAHGMIYLHFSTTNRQFANHGVGMFVMECRRLSRELIPRTELEARILYMHDYEFIEPFSTLTGELAVNVINAVSCGDTKLTKFHARGKKLKSFLNRGGREKLREVASKYLSGHNATVLFEPK